MTYASARPGIIGCLRVVVLLAVIAIGGAVYAGEAQAGTYMGEYSYIAFHPAGQGEMWLTTTPEYYGGAGQSAKSGACMAAGTSPTISAIQEPPKAVYKLDHRAAVQACNNSLTYWDDASKSGSAAVSFAPGASPAIAYGGLPNFGIAFRGSTGTLWTDWTSNDPSKQAIQNTGLAIASGTNPSITHTEFTYRIAFQGANNDLWTYTPAGGAVDLGLGMAPGTSPCITWYESEESNYWVIAFQANTGHLWIYNPYFGGRDTGAMMASGTNPTIGPYYTGLSGYVAGFQASNAELSFYASADNAIHGLHRAMEPGTSPSFASRNPVELYWDMAYVAPGRELWSYSNVAGAYDLGFKLEAGTSPSATI